MKIIVHGISTILIIYFLFGGDFITYHPIRSFFGAVCILLVTQINIFSKKEGLFDQ